MAFLTYDVSGFPVGLLKNGGVVGAAAWGTAGADSLDALELNGNTDKIIIDEDVKHYESPIAGIGTRSDDLINHQANTKGSVPKFEYKPRIGFLKDEGAPMLMSHMQSCTEEATTPFKKVLIFGNPDFTVNAGLFMTAVAKSPVASQSLKLTDVIGVEKLGFSIAPGGYLQAAQNFRGRCAVNAASNPSGTWARADVDAAVDRFHYNDMNMKINFGGGSTAVDPQGEQTWETSREVIEAGTDPTNHTFKSLHLGKNSGAFKLGFNYDSNAYGSSNSAKVCFRAGTAITVDIWFGTETPAVDGDLKFTFMGVIKSASFPGGETGIVHCEIEGVIVGDNANSTEMYTVTLVDTIDQGY